MDINIRNAKHLYEKKKYFMAIKSLDSPSNEYVESELKKKTENFISFKKKSVIEYIS